MQMANVTTATMSSNIGTYQSLDAFIECYHNSLTVNTKNYTLYRDDWEHWQPNHRMH